MLTNAMFYARMLGHELDAAQLIRTDAAFRSLCGRKDFVDLD